MLTTNGRAGAILKASWNQSPGSEGSGIAASARRPVDSSEVYSTGGIESFIELESIRTGLHLPATVLAAFGTPPRIHG